MNVEGAEKIKIDERSNIMHPGNGYNFPQKGDYVKVNLQLYDKDGQLIFDSAFTKKKFLDFRFGCNDSNIAGFLELLIGKMSLFEKLQLTLDTNDIQDLDSRGVASLLQDYEIITFVIEIIHISKAPHLI